MPTIDHKFVDDLRRTLNTEVARRLLIKYFISKGYDDFDRLVYPPSVHDLPYMIPEMSNVVEVVPHTNNVNPYLNSAEIGWNLFVLGNQRQYLGETYHSDLHSLALQISNGSIISENVQATRQTTPRQIIHFITRIIGTHKSGYINMDPAPRAFLSYTLDTAGRQPVLGASGHFYNKISV